MTLWRGVGGAVVLASLTLAAGAADPPASGKSKGQPTTERDNKAVARLNHVTGRVVSVSGTERSLTLRLEYQTLQPKPGAKGGGAGQNQLYQRMQSIRRSGNPLQQAARQQQLLAQVQASELRALQNSFRLVNEHKDFDMVLTAKAPVRWLKIPFEYDDKGFPRQYTTKELAQMKGNDPNLPGYAAEFDKLKPGDSVRVTLAHGSDAETKDSKVEEGKDKDREIARPDKRIKVSMVLILGEGPDPNPPARGGKKGQ